MGKLETEYVTLAATPATDSSVIDLRDRILRGIAFPSDWAGSAAVSFKVGIQHPTTPNLITYVPVDDLATDASGASKVYIPISADNPDDAVRCLGLTKLICTAEAGARTIAILTEQRD